MSLPPILRNIFQHRQKSYKMVLILSLLNEMRDVTKPIPLENIARRFLAYYQEREEKGLAVDPAPRHLATSWKEMTLSKVISLLDTPISALSSVLSVEKNGNRIGFQPEVLSQTDANVMADLRNEALKELEKYHNQIHSKPISIKSMLANIMSNYLQAKREPFGGHQLGNYVRNTVPEELKKLPFIDDRYKVQGSVGQGNWATVPWIAILDRRITESTQSGIYICYLFAEDMKSVYLTLMLGVTNPLQEMGRRDGYQYLRNVAAELRNRLPLESFQKDENIRLTDSGLGRVYQVSTIAYVRYDDEHLPEDDVLIEDLRNLIENYQMYVDEGMNGPVSYATKSNDSSVEDKKPEAHRSIPQILDHINRYIREQGFTYPDLFIENFFLSLKTKPFVILAGISGTGKTKLVKLFAEAVGATEENGQFMQIPVRPDWSDSSDLLGYTDLSGSFRVGKITKVLLEASKPENRQKPYLICLDEMNLARVEHYFSDLLSILETKRWKNGEIITDYVLPTHYLSGKDLDTYGKLVVPENVYFVGTVNMDETTYPFSKKVLDRANTIEFNDIDLISFPDEEELKTEIKPIPVQNHAFRSDFLTIKDALKEKEIIWRTTERLVQINRILENIHAQIGFRVRDTICFYSIYNQRYGFMTEEQAFDFLLMQKILPRIQGSSMAFKRCLIELFFFTIGQKGRVDDYMDDAAALYQVWETGKEKQAIYPHSARKIAYMLRRLEEDGFTSFWLS